MGGGGIGMGGGLGVGNAGLMSGGIGAGMVGGGVGGDLEGTWRGSWRRNEWRIDSTGNDGTWNRRRYWYISTDDGDANDAPWRIWG
ncbi:unnamed protein product [Callosobruchus maculatus]|uniref:Uncharacterized protein n=1 Tax=Callosobruchus maculatus TaxID=64391 RepID=A0A653CPW9_CALMS|nr:unnamed protein product [Callosobruchus maculatus]